MKIKSRKAKGSCLQDWVAAKIGEAIKLPVRPDEHIAPREMGQMGPDVRLSHLAREVFPFTVECKNQERWRILEFIRQAEANRYPGTDWLLVLKRNWGKPAIILEAEAFFRLLKK